LSPEEEALGAVARRLEARGFTVEAGPTSPPLGEGERGLRAVSAKISWRGMELADVEAVNYLKTLRIEARLSEDPLKRKKLSRGDIYYESNRAFAVGKRSGDKKGARPDSKRFANILAKKLTELRIRKSSEVVEYVQET
jgi:hypothetical protein